MNCDKAHKLTQEYLAVLDKFDKAVFPLIQREFLRALEHMAHYSSLEPGQKINHYAYRANETLLKVLGNKLLPDKKTLEIPALDPLALLARLSEGQGQLEAIDVPALPPREGDKDG